jgi:N utilization substance protein B
MKPSERKKARHYVTQAIYQWQMTNDDIANIEQQFIEDNDFSKVDTSYFQILLSGVVNNAESLDKQFEPYLDRSLKKIGRIELAILRLGTYELAHCIEVPYKVVINECVDLGKKFAATDAYKYINSILDQVAKELRKLEMRKHV